MRVLIERFEISYSRVYNIYLQDIKLQIVEFRTKRSCVRATLNTICGGRNKIDTIMCYHIIWR